MHDELRDALRRVEPPAGFAERVLRRAAEQPAPPSRPPVVSATQAVSRWAIAATIVGNRAVRRVATRILVARERSRDSASNIAKAEITVRNTSIGSAVAGTRAYIPLISSIASQGSS